MVETTRYALAEAMVRTGNGDRTALREVYTLTSAKLFDICLKVCGERTAAEDVVNDVYLSVWRWAKAWDPDRGSAIAWLAAIARNRSIDWRRAQNNRPEILSIDDWTHLSDTAVGAEAALLSAEFARRVLRCTDALDPRSSHAFRAAFFDGETYPELAGRHGVPSARSRAGSGARSSSCASNSASTMFERRGGPHHRRRIDEGVERSSIASPPFAPDNSWPAILIAC